MGVFHSAGEYHSTLFLELSHITSHVSRLNRDSLKTSAPFGSEAYSREELVAEFGAVFLRVQAEIDGTVDNNAAYIAGWSRLYGMTNGWWSPPPAKARWQ